MQNLEEPQQLSRTAQALEAIEATLHQRRLAPPDSLLYPHSFLNMQDFLSLKKFDLRELQEDLRDLGLSSMHFAHPHLLYTLQRERSILERLQGKAPREGSAAEALTPREAEAIRRERSRFLKNDDARAAVMLTLPDEAAGDPLIRRILAQSDVGIVRINTAHGTPEQWEAAAAMIRKLNDTERSADPIKIYADLAGPKLRTGTIRRLPAPIKLCTRHSTEILLLPDDGVRRTALEPRPDHPDEMQALIVVDPEFYQRLRDADYVEFNDHDRKPRFYKVLSWSPLSCRLQCNKKVLLTPETDIGVQISKKEFLYTHARNFQTLPETIRLQTGDRILLHGEDQPGRLVGDKPYKAEIPCTLGAEIFPQVEAGHRIFIDDGKIELLIEEITPRRLLCRVITTKPDGVLLKEERGINLPDTPVALEALTPEDRRHLPLLQGFADIIGLSFTQNGADVRKLKALLSETPQIAIVPKIETKEGVRRLPEILYELMSWSHGAVMLARGDLTIEVGFENLPRVQMEILSLCEASHTPVIYATQVLESVMKKNLPSRAELIDVSYAALRTDCVMLNKGPFAQKAVEMIDRIIQATRPLYDRGQPMLSRLDEWEGFRDAFLKNAVKP